MTKRFFGARQLQPAAKKCWRDGRGALCMFKRLLFAAGFFGARTKVNPGNWTFRFQLSGLLEVWQRSGEMLLPCLNVSEHEMSEGKVRSQLDRFAQCRRRFPILSKPEADRCVKAI